METVQQQSGYQARIGISQNSRFAAAPLRIGMADLLDLSEPSSAPVKAGFLRTCRAWDPDGAYGIRDQGSD